MGLYKTLKVKDKELKLKLRAKDCVDLENKLGRSPLDVLMESNEGRLPKVGFVILVLQCSLQAYEHGYSLDKVYELYDEIVEDGKDLIDMLDIITDIFQVSGFFNKEKKREEEKQEAEQTVEPVI